MTHDIHVLMTWILVCLIVAALCSTAFPLLYAFFPWRSTLLGKLLMLQAVAFALAMDGTVLFQFWVPSNVLVIFWINAIVFSLIAVASTLLTSMLWRKNITNRRQVKQYKKEKHD